MVNPGGNIYIYTNGIALYKQVQEVLCIEFYFMIRTSLDGVEFIARITEIASLLLLFNLSVIRYL